MAQRQAKLISERTRAALRAAKARGVKLGTDHLTDDDKARGRVPGLATMKAKADTFAHDLAPVVRELREAGRTLREIARHLNAEGFATRHGRSWNATQVMRVLVDAAANYDG
jgi:DNA invertase Pin-like site-specific DNA recombinase